MENFRRPDHNFRRLLIWSTKVTVLTSVGFEADGSNFRQPNRRKKLTYVGFGQRPTEVSVIIVVCRAVLRLPLNPHVGQANIFMYNISLTLSFSLRVKGLTWLE
jgi:hypothetical protein